MTNTIPALTQAAQRSRRLWRWIPVLGAIALLVALTGCGAPPAVGTVQGKYMNPAETEPGTCSGDGVTTPLICTGDELVPAEYFIRVARRDDRYVLVQVDKRDYNAVSVGDAFDEKDLGYKPMTWEEVEYKPGEWATK